MSLSKPVLKRKQLDMKAKIKIIQEYDDAVFKKGKVNKTQFALKHGLAKSSLQTILAINLGSVWTLQKLMEKQLKEGGIPILEHHCERI